MVSSGAHLHCRQRARLGNRRRKHCLSAPPPRASLGPGSLGRSRGKPPEREPRCIRPLYYPWQRLVWSLTGQGEPRQTDCLHSQESGIRLLLPFIPNTPAPGNASRSSILDATATANPEPARRHPPPSLRYKEFPPGIIPFSAESRVPDCPQFVLPSLPKASLRQDCPRASGRHKSDPPWRAPPILREPETLQGSSTVASLA